MIRKNQAFLNRVNILADMLLVVLSYMLASWIRFDFLDGSSKNMAVLSWNTVLLAAAYAVVVFFLLSGLGFYNTTRTRRLVWKIRMIVISVTIATLLASSLLFLFRLVDFSRVFLFVFYLITILFLTGKYLLMRTVLRSFRKKGYNLKHVVVIGTGALAQQYKADLENEQELGFHIKGFIGNPAEQLAPEEILGGFDTLDEQLSRSGINEAVIALEPEEYAHIREIIFSCERNGVKYSVIPFYNDIIPGNPVVETIGRSKLINMRSNRLENYGWKLLKRSFDVLASALGLILLSPLLLAIAVGVKLSSPGPVLFRQVRVGYNKKEFEMLKFRSMRVNTGENTAWTTDKDPRKTKFGSFIRKVSLDELPQLINVLKGDMSLVGPRPELPFFVEKFRETIPYYMVKHQVKPGMTGWAQVNGYRGDTSIEKRIELDLWYIENWSPWLDIRILFRTFFGGIVNSEKVVRNAPKGAGKAR